VIEAAQQAQAARARLGLALDGPVPDILRAVEGGSGLAVSIIDLPNGISGAYARRQGQGFAFVGLGEAPVRQRFTLAHELGHHEFRDGGVLDSSADVFGRPVTMRERRANAFAAEFLAPLAAVQRWMQTHADSEVSLVQVVALASWFRVSAQVALYRLSAARIISAKLARTLEQEIQNGVHTQVARRHQIDDLPDQISQIHLSATPRLPARLWADAVTGYERGLLTPERIAEAVGRSVGEVEAELAALDVRPPDDEPDY
jgi:Zn-dependent peptidase ImmA (M78 family)